jgi:sporulation protein YunB
MLDFRIRPTLIQLARVTAQKIAIRAINESIQSNISPDIQYQNLMNIQLNTEGRVSFIQPNTGAINRISSEATLAVQKKLQDLPKVTVKIPLWQIFGSRILAGSGPELPVKIIPVGLVESNINDHFDQAGINQTRHRIFVKIKATVKVIVPLVTEEVQVYTDIPLAEAVIVGDVPGVYMGNGGIIIPSPMNPSQK